MTDIKPKYAGDGAFTVTNLHSLASSSTNVSGWASAARDNGSDLALDVLVSGEFKVHNSNAPTAGKTIKVYAFAIHRENSGSPVWPTTPASYSGSEGTYSCADEEERDSGLVLLWSSAGVDTTTGAVHVMPPRSIAAAFGGTMPQRWALWVVQDTGQALHSAGNLVDYTLIQGTLV